MEIDYHISSPPSYEQHLTKMRSLTPPTFNPARTGIRDDKDLYIND